MTKHQFMARVHRVINPVGDDTLVLRLHPPSKEDQLRDLIPIGESRVVYLEVK